MIVTKTGSGQILQTYPCGGPLSPFAVRIFSWLFPDSTRGEAQPATFGVCQNGRQHVLANYSVETESSHSSKLCIVMTEAMAPQLLSHAAERSHQVHPVTDPRSRLGIYLCRHDTTFEECFRPQAQVHNRRANSDTFDAPLPVVLRDRHSLGIP